MHNRSLGHRGGQVKGQVTLFVMVGLMLLIVVWLAFVFRGRDLDATRGQGTQIQGSLDNAELNNHIQYCIDAAVEKELLEFGKTGGVNAIEAMTDSAHKREYHVARVTEADSSRTEILYGLMQNRRGTGAGDLVPHKTVPPQYPIESLTSTQLKQGIYLPSNPAQKLLSFQEGYFGQTGFIPLCDKNGPNGPDALTLCKSYPATPPGTPNTMSVQEALQPSIQNDADGCINRSYFLEQGYEMSDPKATIEFSDSAVLVNLTIPLKKGSEAVWTYHNRRYPIRFIAVAQFAQEMAKQMTVDPTFDPTDEASYSKLNNYREGFSVERRRLTATEMAPTESQFSDTGDLIMITDEGSTIRGSPFVFRFLIERRYPMLEPIPTDITCDRISCEPDGSQCSYLSASSASIPILGVSPDGLNDLAFSFEGLSSGCKIAVTSDSLSDFQRLDDSTQ